jgi:hypothetical protein
MNSFFATRRMEKKKHENAGIVFVLVRVDGISTDFRFSEELLLSHLSYSSISPSSLFHSHLSHRNHLPTAFTHLIASLVVGLVKNASSPRTRISFTAAASITAITSQAYPANFLHGSARLGDPLKTW